MSNEQLIPTPDGRTLCVALWGPADGVPVACLHGTPGSRLNRYPSEAALTEAGVRLITYDRPGYGNSTPLPGREVASVAADVVTLSEALRIDRLPVLGYSGGAPHALACAALLPDLVPRAAAVAGIAPYDAAGLDWLAGQLPDNVEEFHAAAAGRDRLEALLAPAAAAVVANPDSLLDADPLPQPDQAALRRPDVGGAMAAAMAEGLRSGAAGWVDDDLAFVRPWGFDPAAIETPIGIWHGALDVFAPATHASWLADVIAGAEYHLSADDGHLSLQRYLPAVLAWLLR